MAGAVVTQVAFAGIWMTAGAVAMWVVTEFRRERAEAAAEQDRTEGEFAPTLSRVRAVQAVAGHRRPSWLPGAPVEGWRVRAGVVAAAVWGWVRSRLVRPSVVATPAPAALPADPVARDANSFTWPTNPSVATAAPTVVATAAVDSTLSPQLDFAERIRAENDWLHRQARHRLTDPDATRVIAAVQL